MHSLNSEIPSTIACSRDLEVTRDGFRRMASVIGVDWYAYALISGDGALRYFDSTYPDAWISHYLAHNYREIDPVVSEARRTRLPFAWRRLAARDLSTAQLRMFDEASAYGLRDGYTIPFEPRDGGVALLSLAFESSARLHATLQFQPQIRGLAQTYHIAVERLLADGETDAERLSDDERRSLTGIAAGHSLWQIATQLHLPENNIGRLLRNARIKLGAKTTAEAVWVARERGLIGGAYAGSTA